MLRINHKSCACVCWACVLNGYFEVPIISPIRATYLEARAVVGAVGAGVILESQVCVLSFLLRP